MYIRQDYAHVGKIIIITTTTIWEKIRIEENAPNY